MSYNIYLREPRCEHCKRDGKEIYDGNMTSNVSGIWYRALMVAKGEPFQADLGQGSWPDVEFGAFGPLRDAPGDQAAAMCLAASDHIHLNPELYKPFEPDNGWGSTESAARLLLEIGAAWRAHPSATITVSR